MTDRRVAIPRKASAELEALFGQRIAIERETAGMIRGLAYGLGIDPEAVATVDTNTDELVLAAEPEPTPDPTPDDERGL